ncbi:MAG: putative metal-binding motif-containing protein [Pseudomonadota bacterium]
MKNTRNSTNFYVVGSLVIALSGCSGGEDGTTAVSQPPYPDPSNPSAFPTQADTLEGSSGDNTPGTATNMAIGDTSYHTNYPIGDVDWIEVTLNVGIQYEFSVDNVSFNGEPKLELYSSSNTTNDIVNDTGYFSNNPRILYTPTTSGTYYLKVYDNAGIPGGVSSYTLSSRVFSDGEGDTFSPHYDCNDTDADIYPWAVEIADDSIDQSCSGYDWPVATATDSFEPDGTSGTAGSLPMLKGDPWDIIHRGEVYAETHTSHVGDVDWFKITVPAHTFYDLFDIETNGINFDSKLYKVPDLVTPDDSLTSSGFIVYFLDNTASAVATDYYLEVKATAAEAGVYALGVGDGGTDVDGDGYYTRSQGSGWDCNDSNADIFAGAPETPSDGTDSNCNGKDDT